MKPFTVIMQPHWAAHHLTRRAIRKYPDIPDTDNEAYLNLFSGVVNIMAGAAANGELQLIAYPLWWPIPAHMAVDEDGQIVQGAGVTDTALHEWMKSFDADIIANKQGVDDFRKELRGDDASTEPETVMQDGTRLMGDFSHGNKIKQIVANKDELIREALDAQADKPKGEASEKERIINYLHDKYDLNEGTLRGKIQIPDIKRVKNEKREK